MTPAHLEKLAREAGMSECETFGNHLFWSATPAVLARFASLVRAAALEEAAKVCEEKVFDGWDCAVAIRALSKQEGGE